MVAPLKIVIKRKGHREEYDQKKVYGSVYFAVMNCHESEKTAEQVAEKVSQTITAWITKQQFLESKDIKEKITEELYKVNEDYALMYRTHLDLC